jgi:predicted ArsR family transcriptional regulator
MARELLDRETAGVVDSAQFGAALERACSRVAENLRTCLGEDGYRALLARAFATTHDQRALFTEMQRMNAAGIDMDVVTGVETHGVATVSDALEALLAALVDILSELIGADMVRSLLDQDASAALDGRRTP